MVLILKYQVKKEPQMRAVVIRGGAIEVVEMPDPAPASGQVLIAPEATGICGSDLHFRHVMADLARANPDASVSIVPGHEFAGEVVAIGPGTSTGLRVGDVVTSIPFTYGSAGPATIGLSVEYSGGLAGFTIADASRTFVLPDGVSARLGALCEPVAVAVHAFAQAGTNGPIVVVGVGPIGLGIVAIAALNGRHPIIAVDPSASRRAMAHAMGADVAVAPGATLSELLADIGYRPDTISPLLDGEPVPATVFECVGRPQVVQRILAEAPLHSRIVLTGACMHAVEIQPLQLTTSEVTVATSFAYRPHEFRQAAEYLQRDPDRFARLITSEQPLQGAEKAFDALAEEPDEVKILIRPQQ